MLLKSTALSLFIVLLCGDLLLAKTPPKPPQVDITVIYPRPDQQLTAVDSTFILGNVKVDNRPVSDYQLEINGRKIPIHKDGGFLAFLPLAPGDFVFYLNVFNKSSRSSHAEPAAQDSVPVKVPVPVKSLTTDSIAIAGDYGRPGGNLVLRTGDLLEVSFQGTPGQSAWFALPGAADSVPMAETSPRQQAYWGESVFGRGRVPDSVLLRGIYTGLYLVPDSVQIAEVPIWYFLSGTPSPSSDTGILTAHRAQNDSTEKPSRERSSTTPVELHPDSLQTKSLTSTYLVSLNPPGFPFTVRFKDSIQTIRHAPMKGYFTIFQPRGVEALAVGAEGDWLKLQLSETQYAWANGIAVETLSTGVYPPQSQLTVVRSRSYDDSVRLEFALSGMHPFRVIEDDLRQLRIQLFGVTSNTDWIRYDFSDELIDVASWSQPEPNQYELRLNLTQDVWGYDAYYEANRFCFVLHRPPNDVKSLRGKTIVIDPGHSGDPGSIGPTGLREADANLNISLVLAKELTKRGAHVIMTRTDTSHVPLADRPVIARAAAADLFVSIHNNALPDGVNPFENTGVSTYYYHPHSIKLAKSILTEIVKNTGQPNYGLFHGNLAVCRPTQYPAVLVECAFMIVPEQEAMLKTHNYQSKVARAVTVGIEKFLKTYNGGH